MRTGDRPRHPHAMHRSLPPLNALRAFEAAARHLSFTRAAAELHVTQAAISHQIKGLEDWLGAPLFRRVNRTLLLTEAGQAYVVPVREALGQIADATDRLFRRDTGGVLTISTMPSFAAKWLVMRLGRFQAAHPDLEVRLHTSSHLIDFTDQDVDVGIRLGRGQWQGVFAERLMTEDVFPVCAPALRDGPKPIRTPADLMRHTLLHDDYLISWSMWFAAATAGGALPAGAVPPGAEVDRGPRFTDSALLLQSAIGGHGVALGRRVLVAEDLAAGRLVRLFDVTLPGEYAYYVVTPAHSRTRPKVRLFRDWLFAEVAADGAV